MQSMQVSGAVSSAKRAKSRVRRKWDVAENDGKRGRGAVTEREAGWIRTLTVPN